MIRSQQVRDPCQGCTLSTGLEEVYDYDNKANKYYWFIGLQATNTIG